MDKLKYVKLEQQDGSYSAPIPLSVDGEYVIINGEDLETILGDIEITTYGDLANQLQDIRDRLDALEGQGSI